MCEILWCLTSEKPGHRESKMTNWHALPLELKNLILSAYIDCVVHNRGDDEWRVDTSVLWYKPPSTRLTPLEFYPPEFTLTSLLLVAPELKQGARDQIDQKLSATTRITPSLMC